MAEPGSIVRHSRQATARAEIMGRVTPTSLRSMLPGSDDQDISQKPVSLCPPAVTQPVREAFSLTLTSFDGVSCQYWQLFRIESALTRTNIATSRLVSTDISTITSSEMHSFAPLQLGYSAVPCYEQNPSLAAGSGIR